MDELPEVSGLGERWGRDVLQCPYCHGWEVRDKAVGVLASGPLAVHQALLFRQLSPDVLFFQHTMPRLGEAERDQLAARGIRLVEGEVVGVEVRRDQLTGVRLRSEVVPREAVVVGPRFTARNELLVALGLAPAEQQVDGQVIGSYLPADPAGGTAVPGVWVAGNVADLAATVIGAAAAGVRAGAAINADLVAEDVRHAIAAGGGLREVS